MAVTVNHRGYTLIELIVVVALISMMLFFSVPRFQRAVFVNDTRQFSQWLTANVKVLKERSVREQRNYRLHVAMAEGRLWITHDGMSEEEIEDARNSAYQLPSGLLVMDVEYPGHNRVSSGRADIAFYRKGYSDRVLIHVKDDDDNRFSYLIECFLSNVEITEGYIGFEG